MKERSSNYFCFGRKHVSHHCCAYARAYTMFKLDFGKERRQSLVVYCTYTLRDTRKFLRLSSTAIYIKSWYVIDSMFREIQDTFKSKMASTTGVEWIKSNLTAENVPHFLICAEPINEFLGDTETQFPEARMLITMMMCGMIEVLQSLYQP